MKRVHCTFCGQTFLTDTTGRCPLCRNAGGLVAPDSPAAMLDVVTRKQAEAPPPGVAVASGLTEAGRVALLTSRVVRLLIGAVVAIGLGILLMVHPDFRGHRGSFRASDLWPGSAAVVAGLGMIGLAIYLIRRFRASAARSPTLPDRPASPSPGEGSPSA
jgi:hypothetical protein